jgi:hypothetical protein
MVFSNLLAHRDDDALPIDHCSQAEHQRNCYLHPCRNELRGVVDMLLVVAEDGRIFRRELWHTGLLHQAQRFAYHVHVVAEVAHRILRDQL